MSNPPTSFTPASAEGVVTTPPKSPRRGTLGIRGAVSSKSTKSSAEKPERPARPRRNLSILNRRPVNPNVKQVRLTLVYVDFWSALKMSFMVGLAQAIVTVIATFLLYLVFVQTGIFDRANSVVGQVVGGNGFDVRSIVSMGQSIAFAAIVGILNMVVITVMGAVIAVIYNAIAKIVGGLKVGFISQ